MTVTARNSDTNRLIAIVHGKSSIASLKAPFMVINNGKKIILIHNVASIIGMKYCCADSMAAFFGSMPFPRYSRYPSITTMELPPYRVPR